jgi:hypothetical protein
MNLSKYDDFLGEQATPEEIEKKKQKALKSHMRLFLSADLAHIFKVMSDPYGIANELLTLSRYSKVFDISFIDKSDKNDAISYIPTNRVQRLEEGGLDIKAARSNYKSEIWTSPQRQEMKIGKFLVKIFKDKYSAAQIEKFVNEYKSKSEEQDDKLKVVYGEEIRKWYQEKRYSEGGGTLNGSCMRSNSCQPYFDIYCKNTPDNEDIKSGKAYSWCGMLILTDDNDKLLARAIVWFNTVKPQKINEKGERISGRVFMDRIYSNADHHMNTLKDYAKKKGWLYKQQQTFSNPAYIDPVDDSKHTLTLACRLRPMEFGTYPYMDTMIYYSPSTGRLASSPGKYVGHKRLKIQSTGGNYEQIPDR